MRNEELGVRNEELGINAFAQPWRVLLCGGAVPRAVLTADGFCPFRGQVGALLEDCEYAWIGLLEHWKRWYSGAEDCKSDRAKHLFFSSILVSHKLKQSKDNSTISRFKFLIRINIIKIIEAYSQ